MLTSKTLNFSKLATNRFFQLALGDDAVKDLFAPSHVDGNLS